MYKTFISIDNQIFRHSFLNEGLQVSPKMVNGHKCFFLLKFSVLSEGSKVQELRFLSSFSPEGT